MTEPPPLTEKNSVDFSGLIQLPRRAATSNEQLRSLISEQPAFSSVPEEPLHAALGSGDLEILELERDQLLIANTSESLYYLCAGQVALGVFKQEDVDERRRLQDVRDAQSDAERSLLPLPPLAHTAHKNLARFESGDIFNASALSSAQSDLAFYSLTPTTVLRFGKEALADLTSTHQPLADSLSKALTRTHTLLAGITGVKQEIFDFYLRHGLCVSGPTMRVRQLDLCIECNQCEEACQERHAAKRLTLGGFRLGMLDFVFSCRTCVDQRCLSPCEHDSISFDQERGEVVIDHSKCIGCSLCAQSCPYGAIDMVNVSEPEEETFNFNLKARLTAKGFLDHGPGKTRSDPTRRVANKCDHCHGFAEQACVSACPTGALVELDMRKLFGDQRAVNRSGSGGFQSPSFSSEFLPIRPFTSSVGVKDAGLARIRGGSFGVWIWGLGLLAWFLVAGEVFLRHYAPTLSLQYHLLLADGLRPALAKLGVGYLPGSRLALLCGYTGSALLVISMAYPARRRLRLFMKSASNKYWLDLHLMTGTVGPLFILVHSALVLDNWVSVPFGSMLMVISSGLLGRYLYTLIPSMTHGHEIENLALRAQIASVTAEQPLLARATKDFINDDLFKTQSGQENIGLWALLFWLLGDEAQRIVEHARRRAQLRKLTTKDQAHLLVALCGRVTKLERRALLAPRARLFLKSWKYIHVPFAVLMMVTAITHIILAIKYSM